MSFLSTLRLSLDVIIWIYCVADGGCVTLRTTVETTQTNTRMCARARTVRAQSRRCAATTASVSQHTGAATMTMTAATAVTNSTAATSSAR